MRYRRAMHDNHPAPPLTTLEEIRAEAARVSLLLRDREGDTTPAAGGGSAGRGLPEELRRAVIDVRAALFRRGIYDPLLVRFDSATTAPASNGEIAAQLQTIAESLRG
jgi:hypothetical protein